MLTFKIKRHLDTVFIYVFIVFITYVLSFGIERLLSIQNVKLEGLLSQRLSDGTLKWSIAVSLGFIFSSVNKYKKAISSITSLEELYTCYLGIIFDFTMIYFFFSLVYRTEMPIKGITIPDFSLSAIQIIKTSVITFTDCFHFSLVTATTVGYGNMTPETWYAKLFVDIQLLLSLFVFAIGVSKVLDKPKEQEEK